MGRHEESLCHAELQLELRMPAARAAEPRSFPHRCTAKMKAFSCATPCQLASIPKVAPTTRLVSHPCSSDCVPARYQPVPFCWTFGPGQGSWGGGSRPSKTHPPAGLKTLRLSSRHESRLKTQSPPGGSNLFRAREDLPACAVVQGGGPSPKAVRASARRLARLAPTLPGECGLACGQRVAARAAGAVAREGGLMR